MKFGGWTLASPPKVRPALILSDYPADNELALLVVIPHTTALRGNRWELSIPKPFLKPAHFTSNNSNRSRLCASMPESAC